MKERSEKKIEIFINKDNCLRIPNITRNLSLSHSFIEIIAIEVRAFSKIDFQKWSILGNSLCRLWVIPEVVENPYFDDLCILIEPLACWS